MFGRGTTSDEARNHWAHRVAGTSRAWICNRWGRISRACLWWHRICFSWRNDPWEGNDWRCRRRYSLSHPNRGLATPIHTKVRFLRHCEYFLYTHFCQLRIAGCLVHPCNASCSHKCWTSESSRPTSNSTEVGSPPLTFGPGCRFWTSVVPTLVTDSGDTTAALLCQVAERTASFPGIVGLPAFWSRSTWLIADPAAGCSLGLAIITTPENSFPPQYALCFVSDSEMYFIIDFSQPSPKKEF